MAASLDGKTILKPETFKLMVTDQVGPTSGVQSRLFLFPRRRVRLRPRPCGPHRSRQRQAAAARPDLGELKWDGASGCYFVIDPKQDMFFVLLEQTPTERQRVQRTLKQLVYEAMEK